MHLETQIVPVPLDTMRQTELITPPQLAPDEPVGVGLGPTAQPTTHNYPRLKAPFSCLQKVFCLRTPSRPSRGIASPVAIRRGEGEGEPLILL